MTTKHYMTRDLYKGSWKDVLAKYESLTAENGKAKIKPRFVAEGSAVKHLDKIAELLGHVKESHDLPKTQDSVVNVPKHYPVFEIIEVRTIRRACPSSEDVIKWREGASAEDLDLHTIAASYRIVEVTHGNSEPPREPPVPTPMTDSKVTSDMLPITQTTHTTSIPSEFTTKVEVTPQVVESLPTPPRKTPVPRKQSTPIRRKVVTTDDDYEDDYAPAKKVRIRSGSSSRRKTTA